MALYSRLSKCSPSTNSFNSLTKQSYRPYMNINVLITLIYMCKYAYVYQNVVTKMDISLSSRHVIPGRDQSCCFGTQSTIGAWIQV